MQVRMFGIMHKTFIISIWDKLQNTYISHFSYHIFNYKKLWSGLWITTIRPENEIDNSDLHLDNVLSDEEQLDTQEQVNIRGGRESSDAEGDLLVA